MKKIILTIIAACAMQLSTAGVVDDTMAKYVYPDNAPEAESMPAYSADGLTYLTYNTDARQIERYDTKTGKLVETVMALNHTRENTLDEIEGFTLSPDGSKILVWTDKEMIYRRSFTAKYYIYEIRSRILRPLSTEHVRQRAPLFSPDGRMVAFTVEDNNIHIKKIDYDTEVAVTRDGEVNKVINGVPDWTYEEEFVTDCSMAWAPDNLTLCFLKYNEADVPAYSFELYQGTCKPMNQYALYPGSYTYKYPVAGQPNSVVTLHSYDVETRKVKDITLPDRNIEYIPRISYAYDPARLIVTTLDRDQRRMDLYAVNPRSGVAKSIFTEQSEAWLPTVTYENLTLNEDGFVILSSRSGYAHLYKYSYAGTLLEQITSGDFNVTAYYGADKERHYFQSTRSGSINRVISAINSNGKIEDITAENGWSIATFTPAMNYFMLNWSDAATPPVYKLCDNKGKTVRNLTDNAGYAARYSDAPVKEFTTITTSDGIKLNAYVIKPKQFDPSKRYPVIMNQYSGPGSQEVVNRWRMDWCQYFAAKGYVVVCVDPRGTGGRDRQFETIVYKRLGHYESIDLRSAARYFATLPYVDAGRIGITGWSYGGYETLMAISASDSPFKAAVAIAPVTSWRYYDTVYAERYMLTPGQNDDGYNESAPIEAVDKMNIPLLIMHGTADDNVHLMNTMQYISALQGAGKWCDLWLYPNMNHSINGCDMRLNVYSRMLEYFNQNL